ncbi:MAG: hypothetical protein ACRDRK_22960 [Pseudonocardia sp.]
MITHDLLTAGRFADRVVVMYLGRIIEQGAARDVPQTPGIPTRGHCLSTVPRLDPADRTGGRQGLRGRTALPGRRRIRLPVPPSLPERAGALPRGRSVLRRPDAAAPGHCAACILL